MKEVLSDFLRILGIKRSVRADDHLADADEEVRLYLSQGTDRLLVGRLRKDGSEFVFSYSPEFASRLELPPLSDFPRRDKEYRSPDLWPFFLARLPPTDRPDVRKEIVRQGIEPANTLEVLGRLGQRAISSPYELELGHN